MQRQARNKFDLSVVKMIVKKRPSGRFFIKGVCMDAYSCIAA